MATQSSNYQIAQKLFIKHDTDKSNALDYYQLVPFLNQIFKMNQQETSYVNNVQQVKMFLKYTQIDKNKDSVVSRNQIPYVVKNLININDEIHEEVIEETSKSFNNQNVFKNQAQINEQYKTSNNPSNQKHEKSSSLIHIGIVGLIIFLIIFLALKKFKKNPENKSQ